MNRSRLEAFSDSVMAIIITFMAVELKIPDGDRFDSLVPVLPYFISYFISFVLIGNYWINHHHLLMTVKMVNTPIILANLHFLLWLALVPPATAWLGATHFKEAPLILYGGVLLCCTLSYRLLESLILRRHDDKNALGKAIRKQGRRVAWSVLALLLAMPAAYLHWTLSAALFFVHSGLWLLPSQDIEDALSERHKKQEEAES